MARGLVITVNGRRHRVRATRDTPLLYVLRNELELRGPRFGCGLEQCGACRVHLGDEVVQSCVTPAEAAARLPVTTVEGLGSRNKPHPVVEAFIAEQAAQCGFCINGQVMTAVAFLRRNPNPTEAQIKRAMDRTLCRCGTHYRIIRAIQRAAKKGVV